ncbi:MAG: DNA primase [Defluviitaleaceae bacterium]|nr:DNA primase [Defluviitaleaceae bacterium]
MFYSHDVIAEVKALNDIVDVVGSYVRLSPSSGNFFGLCPFHNEKTPSFSVNRDKQIFYCFGCGAGGNVLSFVKRIENMDFPDALRLLADRAHFNLPEKGANAAHEKMRAAARETAAKLNKSAARFFYDNLHDDAGRDARKYLENRGLNIGIMRKFGLGYAPDVWDALMTKFPDVLPADFETAGLVKKSEKSSGYYDRFRGRLMFPIIDNRERVIGFGGRIMKNDGDGAKYLNSPETALFRKSECLYGLNLAKKAGATEIIVVEGYMDVIAMHAHGFANVVGVLGTAMGQAHARLLKNTGANTLILMLDSDDAGIRAALRAIPILVKAGLKVKILNLPDAKDPDEYLSRFGAQKFKSLLATAQNHINFQVGLAKSGHNLETTEGRIGFTQAAAKILATLQSAIEIDAYAKDIEKESGIALSAIYKEIEKISGEVFAKREFNLAPRTYVTKKHGEDIGLKNAKKGLVSLLFSHIATVGALKDANCLSPEEMGDSIWGKLLDLAYGNRVKSPSDIFDHFEDDEAHHTIAEIFADTSKESSADAPSKAAVEKALNDCVKKIKLSWIDSRMEIEKNDLNAVNALLFEKKSINLLNITLNDG